MTKEQFAAQLEGRDRRNVISKAEIKLAKDNNLLIVFGVSDDLMQFCGILNERYDAFGGREVFLHKNTDEEIAILSCYDAQKIQRSLGDKIPFNLYALIIGQQWQPKEINCAWIIYCNAPHAIFDIYDIDDNNGKDLFCRGMVLEKNDIKKHFTNIA